MLNRKIKVGCKIFNELEFLGFLEDAINTYNYYDGIAKTDATSFLRIASKLDALTLEYDVKRGMFSSYEYKRSGYTITREFNLDLGYVELPIVFQERRCFI